ncbi:hypothetical protein [Vibrio phage BONAISHI]|nr:hypothetical protein [Vibrio phage BONAISHI]
MGFKLSGSKVGDLFSEQTKEYFSADFVKIIETHINWLMQQSNASEVTIGPVIAKKYQGDFYGLLANQGLDPRLWYATMRCTGLTTFTENDDKLSILRIPSLADVTSLMSRYKIKT